MEQKPVIATKVLEDVINSSSTDRLPVADIIGAMEGVGFGLAILIFAFGIIIPLPPPLPSLISIPLVIFALQMMAGYKAPRLPTRIGKYTVKRSVLASLVRQSSPYIGKVEKILKPRLSFMVTLAMERFVGFFIFIFATFILIPMPLSNFIPGLGILVMSFGLLGRDGLAILVGMAIGLMGMAISITALFLGVEALSYIKDWILKFF